MHETTGPSSESDNLIRRAPSGYLWNQAFSLWLFFSLFLYQLIITRILPVEEKGVYELVLTPANFAVYLAALGLESAGSVYLPRAFAEGGSRQAMAVAARLVATRMLALLVVAGLLLWEVPALAGMLRSLPLPGAADLAATLSYPALVTHRAALVGYLVGVGLSNLMAALLTALLRTRAVFIAGSIAQLLTIGLAYVLVGPLDRGADGALAALAWPSVLTALVYAIVLYRVLGSPSFRFGRPVLGGMLRLGIAAWLADLANGSLIKLIAVTQLAAGVARSQATVQVAYFGIAFELGHAAAFLFVAGLGGVGLAAMSAAYAGKQRAHLATAWRTISKLQVLLAVPLVAFCVLHADAIMRVLYGQRYAAAGSLLALFLALNALVRVAGGGAHDAALYVLGRQHWVVISRWGSLVVLALADILLIPRFSVAGGLLAVGLAQVASELFTLVLARLALARHYPMPFVWRVLAALTPALLVTALWRPSSLVGLVLSGVLYALIFLVCLRLVRPLDGEDEALLREVPVPLRTILQPFVTPQRAGAEKAAMTPTAP